MASEEEDKDRRPLTRSEKVRNYLVGLGAASALILGLVTQFKGEPVADAVWAKLRKRVNRQDESIHKLHVRMIHLQGLEEGYNAGKLIEKLEQLQKKYDALKAKTTVAAAPVAPKPTAIATATKPRASTDCKEGFLEVGGRCKRVPKAVAKAVKAEVSKAKRKLVVEKKRFLELERKKAALTKKLATQQQQVRAIPKPAPLPAKVEDAD
jgi:hypothetical protein